MVLGLRNQERLRQLRHLFKDANCSIEEFIRHFTGCFQIAYEELRPSLHMVYVAHVLQGNFATL